MTIKSKPIAPPGERVFQDDIGGMLLANSQNSVPMSRNVVGCKIHGFNVALAKAARNLGIK